MKKLSFLLIIAAFLGITVFNSCEKIEQSSPITINDTTKTLAYVKGKVYAELDYTNLSTEYAPAGTEIFFKVDVSQYDMNVNAGERYYVVNGSIDALGNYSVEIPSTTKGVTVTIIPDDFEYLVNNGTGTAREVFSTNSLTTFVVQGQTSIVDIAY